MGACPSSMKVPLIGWLMIFGSLASVVLILLASADGEVTLVDTSATKAAAEEPAIFNLEIQQRKTPSFQERGVHHGTGRAWRRLRKNRRALQKVIRERFRSFRMRMRERKFKVGEKNSASKMKQ